MAAAAVNTSSIPQRVPLRIPDSGDAAVTQGCGPGLTRPGGESAAAGSINPGSRPGSFAFANQAQGPPAAGAATAASDAGGDGTAGTALPTGGNFLPLWLLSALRLQPEPTTLPAATSAGPGATPAASSVAPAPAPAATSDNALPPQLLAQKMLELMRVPATNLPAAPVVADGASQPPVSAANVDAGNTAAPIALPPTPVAQANATLPAQPPPDMLAALVKRVVHESAPATGGAGPGSDSATAVPLVPAADASSIDAAPSAGDIQPLLAHLPKTAAPDPGSSPQADASLVRPGSDAPPVPLFVDGHALRTHSVAQPADASAQALRLDVPMRSAEWTQALGDRITWLVDQNLSSAQIRLNPPQLGPIEVRIALAADSTQVSLTAHNLVTRDALDASAPGLKVALAAHGLGNVSVDISQQSFADRSMAQMRANSWEPWQSLAANEVPIAAAGPVRLPPAGRLDAYA